MSDENRLNRTSRRWHTSVGTILVIALGPGRQQQGEYTIRPYRPPDFLYQSSVFRFSEARPTLSALRGL